MLDKYPKFLLGILVLNDKSILSAKTLEELKSRFEIKSYKKGEVICNGKEDFNKLAFIRKGVVRGFVEKNVDEITNWISIEDEFFASANFFSEYFFEEKIDALEDVTIEYLTSDDYQCMLKFEDFRSLSQKIFQDYYVFANRRAFIARIPKAENRLEFFLNNYDKGIIKRCPKKHLASFLVMRSETLSRMLNKRNL